MSYKEFKATVCSSKVAGPQKEMKTTNNTTITKISGITKGNNTVLRTTTTSSSSSTQSASSASVSAPSPSLSNASSYSTAMQQQEHQHEEELQMKMCKLFTFIDDTYRDMRRYNSGLYRNSYSAVLMQTINKYKNGCNGICDKVLESHDMCLKLSQNIARTLDIFKELSACLSDMEEYQYRVCEIMSIFIVCELRLSVDANTQEQFAIAHRIIYIMRRQLVQEEQNVTLYNILRTLVYIPKLYNARDIMCAIFGEFIPIKPVLEVNVLPDKLYMLYIIVFYRWMMMQKDEDDKLLIVNFAESFMKPSVSLCSNRLYGSYLPMYTTHSTATRTILNNLKYYRDIRNASIIDNALKQIGYVVNLCDDDEDDEIVVLDSSPTIDFAQMFDSVHLDPMRTSMSNIKLEEKTLVGTVDLTLDEEATNGPTTITECHDKWLNDFQQLAKQYREAQLLMERHDKQVISNSDKQVVICLDSDSDEGDDEDEEISAAVSSRDTRTTSIITKETAAIDINKKAATAHSNCEDLFVDSYPLTQTPLNCDTDLESLEAEDADDVTKISSRFLTGTLRTYQAKKNNSNLSETEDKSLWECEGTESSTKQKCDKNRKIQQAVAYNAVNMNANFEEEDADYDVDKTHTDDDATIDRAYRRDSIHISSTPPDRTAGNEEDEGTDVQDEHDDLVNEEEETSAYTFLPTTSKSSEKDTFANQIRSMGPYPTYNMLHNNDEVVYSQTLSLYPQMKSQQRQLRRQEKQYNSDSSDPKTPKKQKKKVHFNISPLGPTGSNATLKIPLKPSILQPKYKASDAPEYFHLRGFERFPCAPSIAGSNSTLASTSTSSSIKQQEQQEHIAAAATLFRNIFDRPHLSYGSFSPSSSSVSSRSLTSPAKPETTRKKSRLPMNKKPPIKLRRSTVGHREVNKTESTYNNSEQRFSIIRNREVLNGYHSTGPPGYDESSDDYYGVASDTDIVLNERYKNDAKLRKRCAVVIAPTKELLQYERKRNEMYNEILQRQRRKLELRALEKQREKERRNLGRPEEKMEANKKSDMTAAPIGAAAIERERGKKPRRKSRTYNELFFSSESEFETNFQVRTRRQRQQNAKELQQPLNIQIEMAEVTTSSLLSQIEAHLDKPDNNEQRPQQQKRTEFVLRQPEMDGGDEDDEDVNVNENDIINQQQTCDTSDKGQQTKMRELNLLADIAQHLSPYQLDLPETNKTNNNPPTTTTPSPIQTPQPTATPPQSPLIPNAKVPKEKVIVTEHLIIQSFDNLLEKQPQTSFNIKEQQQQPETQHPDEHSATCCSYAYEPKVNIAAIINSSPSADLLQNNTITNNVDNAATATATTKTATCTPQVQATITSNMRNDKTLEKILEESISVFKSVTSPFNNLNEPLPPARALAPSDNCKTTTIPLLISNVESLNQYVENDEKPRTGDKVLLLPKDTTNENSENKALIVDHDSRTKTNTKENVKHTEAETAAATPTATILSTTLLNSVETAIICAADLTNETVITEVLKVPSTLMAVELSDISLESEISKHLPEIAEPSPVVTDMSDLSNQSDVSKTFALHEPPELNHNTVAVEANVSMISIPDLPLVMSAITQPATTLENGFNQLNHTLNTPQKLNDVSRQEESSSATNVLNTPLKFSTSTDLEGEDSAPLKNALEPENDNNVTKFLDLILNKTVTDAESETRDKIIKELNALTADTTASNSDAGETESNSDITTPLVPQLTQESSIKSRAEEPTRESDTLMPLDSFKNQTTPDTRNEANASSDETATQQKLETIPSTTPSANSAINHPPPKAQLKEDKPPNSPDARDSNNSNLVSNKTAKSSPLKQTLNIKCRVRLKRLNINDHCKSSRKETWMAIPLTKTELEEKSANNNDTMTNCDITTTETTTSLNKKSCLKSTSSTGSSSSSNKRANDELENKLSSDSPGQDINNSATATDMVVSNKKTKLVEQIVTQPQPLTAQQTQPQLPTPGLVPQTASVFLASTHPTTSSSSKGKSKHLKTVTFDLSNLNKELRNSSTSSSSFNHKQKSKSHAHGMGMGCYLKNSKPPRKLPDNTLRAAETLQLFVNTINDSTRTPPPAEFNKKRSPIKNKCIAEDETPRPPPASTLMGTPPCKKACTEKSRSQISSNKCNDQLVSSLATPSISTITSDITTARIYTSSPLDQTLPEYDDNVDTVADTELILPTTTGTLRRKLKRPKKSLTRPSSEPADDISTDDISNQPECNAEDDTDAVVDNEDDVFAGELMPIPAANEHILEEIVSARAPHMGSGTVIRDDYMNIEATATVPVYLFNDESRDLATPEPIQSSDTTNVVDSSSYLNVSTNAHNTVPATAAAATSSAMGNLEKSMLSPSEHEVSSTQETFYQTPIKSKPNSETFGEKFSLNKDKSSSNSSSIIGNSQKPKSEDKFDSKEDDQTSSTTGILQNNQVDTTNHSPEMCTLTLTPTTTTTNTAMTSSRKMRKASTHDEILFNELQQQQQQQQQHHQQQVGGKRKTTNTTTFCAESTSDNKSKSKVLAQSLEELKSNGSLVSKEDKFKKLPKRDKNSHPNELDVGVIGGNTGGGGGGGSSPSTTTTINEEKLARTKRKKQRSSKSSKNKTHSSERSTKIVLKASKLAAHLPAPNPLIITIPKSKILKPSTTTTPPTPTESQDEQSPHEFPDIPNAKLFIEKEKEDITTAALQHHNNNNKVADQVVSKKEWHQTSAGGSGKSKCSASPANMMFELANIKSSSSNSQSHCKTPEAITANKNNTTTASLEKTSMAASKKKSKTSSSSSSSNTTSITTNNKTNSNSNSNNNNLIFVKDKYDLIKSKEKHHHYNHVMQENKDKSRLEKHGAKEKGKEKHHKTSREKSIYATAENVLKLSLTQGCNKRSLASNATSSSSAATAAAAGHGKQTSSSSSKSSKSSTRSSFANAVAATTIAHNSINNAILKSKTNLSISAAHNNNNNNNNVSTHLNTATATSTSGPAASATSSSSTSASPSVTISTNHVRKKFKSK